MISLRAYNKEIESFIDNGQFEEAIAHCKYVLSKFPKCIEAYRNLGKTLLELKKYPEALDIFGRVLTAFPDDFISHVGCSIIIEDQKDLDLAIWHMEQAFDVQPSNLAIQDELRRLFGLRDGEKPSKIRLTRGALVRMYARGELFQQAISEINAILEEDPKRKDLEVILAKMLYLSGSENESVALCNQILEKTPYCFEANRIMQEICTIRNDSDNASVYKNRLISLDPYYQFTLSAFDDQEVPDNKILLEKMVYSSSGSSDFEPPVWSDSPDQVFSSAATQDIDWLKNLDSSADTVPVASPFSVDAENPSYTQEADNPILPDWMEKAGWSATSAASPFPLEKQEPPLSSDIVDEIQPIQPATSNIQSEVLFTNQMNGIQPESEEIIENQIKQPQPAKDDLASLFSEMKEGRMDNEITNDKNGIEKKSASDWQSQFSNPESNDPEKSPSQELPDWLNNFKGEDPTKNKDAEDDMPDWLKNLQSAVEPLSPENEEAKNDLPVESPILENNPAMESPEETLASQIESWNKENPPDLGSSEDLSKEAEKTEPSSEDTIPAWVASVLMTDESVVDNQADELSNANQVVTGGLTPPSEEEEGVISQQTNDELLDWLRGLKTEDQKNQEEIPDSLPEDLFAVEKEAITAYESSESDHDYKIKSVDETQRMIDEAISKAKGTTTESSEILEVEPSLVPDKEPVSEPENMLEPVERFQSASNEPEIPETVSELQSSAASSGSTNAHELSDSLEELIKTQNYANLPSAFDKLIAEGLSFDQLINQVTSAEASHLERFSYWQNLGDIYAHHDQLNLALIAYQKAEDILIHSISK